MHGRPQIQKKKSLLLLFLDILRRFLSNYYDVEDKRWNLEDQIAYDLALGGVLEPSVFFRFLNDVDRQELRM